MESRVNCENRTREALKISKGKLSTCVELSYPGATDISGPVLLLLGN